MSIRVTTRRRPSSDVVFIDVRLPEMSGLEVLERIRHPLAGRLRRPPSLPLRAPLVP